LVYLEMACVSSVFGCNRFCQLSLPNFPCLMLFNFLLPLFLLDQPALVGLDSVPEHRPRLMRTNAHTAPSSSSMGSMDFRFGDVSSDAMSSIFQMLNSMALPGSGGAGGAAAAAGAGGGSDEGNDDSGVLAGGAASGSDLAGMGGLLQRLMRSAEGLGGSRRVQVIPGNAQVVMGRQTESSGAPALPTPQAPPLLDGGGSGGGGPRSGGGGQNSGLIGVAGLPAEFNGMLPMEVVDMGGGARAVHLVAGGHRLARRSNGMVHALGRGPGGGGAVGVDGMGRGGAAPLAGAAMGSTGPAHPLFGAGRITTGSSTGSGGSSGGGGGRFSAVRLHDGDGDGGNAALRRSLGYGMGDGGNTGGGFGEGGVSSDIISFYGSSPFEAYARTLRRPGGDEASRRRGGGVGPNASGSGSHTARWLDSGPAGGRPAMLRFAAQVTGQWWREHLNATANTTPATAAAPAAEAPAGAAAAATTVAAAEAPASGEASAPGPDIAESKGEEPVGAAGAGSGTGSTEPPSGELAARPEAAEAKEEELTLREDKPGPVTEPSTALSTSTSTGGSSSSSGSSSIPQVAAPTGVPENSAPRAALVDEPTPAAGMGASDGAADIARAFALSMEGNVAAANPDSSATPAALDVHQFTAALAATAAATAAEAARFTVEGGEAEQNLAQASSDVASAPAQGSGTATDVPSSSSTAATAAPAPEPNPTQGDSANTSTAPLVCPSDMDPQIFALLPPEVQQEVINQQDIDDSIGGSSSTDAAEEALELEALGLDPEALAALPPSVREEVLAQTRHEQRVRSNSVTTAPTDSTTTTAAAAQGGEGSATAGNATAGNASGSTENPAANEANSEATLNQSDEMDAASIIAMLPPDMRDDALRQADPSSLPPALAAEARRLQALMPGGGAGGGGGGSSSSGGGGGGNEGHGDLRSTGDGLAGASASPPADEAATAAAAAQAAEAAWRRIRRAGQMRLEGERTIGVVSSPHGGVPSPSSLATTTTTTATGGVAGPTDLASLLRLLFLAPPGVPARLLHRPLLNFCSLPAPRRALIACLVAMLQTDAVKARQALQHKPTSAQANHNNKLLPPLLDFPPRRLLGAAYSDAFSGQSQTATGGAITTGDNAVDGAAEEQSAVAPMPSLLAGRLLDALNYLVKHSSRAVYELLVEPPPGDVTMKVEAKGEEETKVVPSAPKRPRLEKPQEDDATAIGATQGRNAPLPPLQLPTQPTAAPTPAPAARAETTPASLPTSFALVEELLSLLARSEYQQSCTQLEQLLMLLEQATLPLAHVCPGGAPPHAAQEAVAVSAGEGAGAGAGAAGARAETLTAPTINADSTGQASTLASAPEASSIGGTHSEESAGATSNAMDEDVPSSNNTDAAAAATAAGTTGVSVEGTGQATSSEDSSRMLPGSAPLGPEETPGTSTDATATAAGATSVATRGSSSSGGGSGRALTEHESRVAALIGRPSSAAGAASYSLDGGYANPSTAAPARGSGGRYPGAAGLAAEAGSGVGGGPRGVGSHVPALHLTGTPPVWVAIPGLQGVKHPTALPGLVQVLALDNCTELAFGRCSKVCAQLSKVPLNHENLQGLLAQLASRLSRGALTDLCHLWAELELYALKKHQERQEMEAAAAAAAAATAAVASSAESGFSPSSSSSSTELASSSGVSLLSAAAAAFTPTPSASATAAPAAQASSLPPLASLLAGSGSVHELKLLRALRVLCSLQGQAPAPSSQATAQAAPTSAAATTEGGGTIAVEANSRLSTGVGGAEMVLALPMGPSEQTGAAAATPAGKVSKLASVELEPLWAALSGCLDVVSDLEGLADADASEGDDVDEEAATAAAAAAGGGEASGEAASGGGGQRRRGMSESGDGLAAGSSSSSSGAPDGGSSAAGMSGGRSIKSSSVASLLVRFLPLIEAFVVVCDENGATTPMPPPADEDASGMELDSSSSSSSSDAQAAAAGAEVVSTPRTASRAAIAAHVRRVSVPGARFRQQGVAGQAASGASGSSSSSGAAAGSSSSSSSSSFSAEVPAATSASSSLVAAPSASVHVSEADESPAAKQLVAFVKRHRVPLNALVRQNPSLLVAPGGSLAPMVKVHRARNVLDFDNKRAYFRHCLRRQRQAATRRAGSLRISVRRGMCMEDSFEQLRFKRPEELRGRLHVTFSGEEGIDAGGLTREWYGVLAKDVFNPGYCLFSQTADGATYQPNAMSGINDNHLNYFKFVGRVVGKAVADGHLFDAHFTRSFYKHMLGLQVAVEDMEAADPEFYKNLKQILSHSLDDLGLDLTFSAESREFGREETRDLVPGGRHLAVTDDNKAEYVTLMCRHRMTSGIHAQIEAFLGGFHDLVPPELISIFNEKELELLISGLPDVDLDDLQLHTEYSGWRPTDPGIEWFWAALRSLTREERALFLQFVTGSAKVPVEGFAQLQGMRGVQKFNIHKMYGNNAQLPAAHTCFNQLDLPEYESEAQTREKILFALRECSEGFGFG